MNHRAVSRVAPGTARISATARTRATVGAAAVLAAVVASLAPTAAQAAPVNSAADAQWSTETLAPGVQVRTGTVQHPGVTHTWTVTVQAPATSRLTGARTWAEAGTRSWAGTTAQKLRDAGFEPRVESVRWPGYADTPHGVMGYRVRVGSFAAQADAQPTSKAITAAGFHTAVAWTGYDIQQPADRENIHVAVIDPHRFKGTVEGTHDGNVAQRETTSSVAAKLHSLVAVNGGFFVTSDADGVQGTMSALGAYRGRLGSMAVGSRAALVLGDGGRHVRVADLTSTATARAGRSSYAIQGINRVPSLVRDCGRPGTTPSELPWQDVTCRLTDDLVQFTPLFGAALPTGAGVQAVLNTSGRVVSVGARGGRVPAGGRVLQGIGTAADWLTANARVGRRITVDETVRDSAGRRVALDHDDSIVSAAPTLVKNGRIDIDAAAEGVVDPQDLSFGYAWANTRQPRTMAGIDRRGRLILATVDGRRTGGSEGFTLYEAADFMRSLGVVQALNLDGGGSTTIALRGILANNPSDAAGERPVGDTVQVIPSGTG
ncbi:phosphodiester glycosidase family protein [Streptomyces spinosirectus]|uniref:phosphodiester glycosidase family protein n=1 Tax=Streptomyces TaxID=1883 RepID=UPI001C9DCD2F|nr:MULTISPECIES: phosphodiester glycosidase family protein [Streptomyces]MBY8340423.1 phosphodiester glycosidase family protein [Streptomyces plumbidurans]UIR18474.1 phosphodiester glycosidase family protein [Streptomyces spinosirectus]